MPTSRNPAAFDQTSRTPLPTRTWQPLIILALGLAIGTTAMVVGHLSPVWRAWEGRLYDARLELMSPGPHPAIALVPLDERQRQDRTYLADLITRLGKGGAKAIGLDVPLDQPAETAADAALTEAITRTPGVIAAANLTQIPPLQIQRPLPGFGAAEGLDLAFPEPDGRIRRTILLYPATNASGQRVLRSTYLLEVLRRFDPALAARHQDSLGSSAWGFRRPGHLAGPLPARDVTSLPVAGKVVLVGPAEELIWQSAALQALLADAPVQPLGRTGNFALCLLAAVVSALGFWSGRPLVGLAVSAGVAAALGLVTTALMMAGWWAYLAAPLMAALGTGLAGAALTGAAELRRRRQVARFFRPYVSPQTVQRMLRGAERLPELKSERRTVTVLFSDIAGFTSIAERLPTEEVVQLLNEYLTAMTRIIFANHGTLDKYIGDEVMAVFGNIGPNDPADDAYRAVKSAIEMQEELGHLQEKWLAEGIVPLQIRIGINTGEALVGNIGSPQQMDFTVIGDMVNTAKRLEGLNKAYNTNILISQATYAYVQAHVESRFLGPAPIKGRHEPVPVYALLGWKPGANVR